MFEGMFEVMFGVSLWEKSIEGLRRVRCSSLLFVARSHDRLKMSTMIWSGLFGGERVSVEKTIVLQNI